MRNCSPLRYPGGKSLMTPFFVELFELNRMGCPAYAEPYAGGAGAAINLLLSERVSDVFINDANIGVFSFWYYFVQNPQQFIDKVNTCTVTLEEWRKQKEIIMNANTPSFELGFATFYMTRTNRSGIINAGPIGGTSDLKQAGAKYKIDCRFNKENLIKRLETIANYTNRIHVSCLDAIDFVRTLHNETFVYLDPPYYQKGECLYMNHYTSEGHAELAQYLINEAQFHWILSYDNVEPIRNLYQARPLYQFTIPYTVQNSKSGKELLTHSENIIFPHEPVIKRSTKDIIIERV